MNTPIGRADTRAPSQFERWLDPRVDRVLQMRLLNNPITRALIGILAVTSFLVVITVPLELIQQLVFFALTILVARIAMRRKSRMVSLFLMLLSICASLRYLFWRLTSSIDFQTWVDALFGYGLLAAELYAIVVLLLGYWQTAWPLRRQPVLMPHDRSQWPQVDVLIPTYNEPLEIVRQTIMAAMKLDWPEEKLHVYLLDDGRREEFRQFCAETGCGYLTRPDNDHAKAGNLNAALTRVTSEYVAIFDCDHVPTRSFLQVSMGWFIKDPKLAMLQTPHVFFSPDPFEKNLLTFRQVPNEGELFYGLVQDGNDLWNATFFCGSCAVMRRSALDDVGGIATGSVTEDALTALKMNRRGWNTAYLSVPQAAGRATETLSRHIGQRIRWARGMAQIFRTNNPLLGRGLSIGQRVCYLGASLHFFHGLPRLVFLTAPMAYMFFGAHVFNASALMIIAYAMPHILMASLTNSYIQGSVRHSFWNEIYETVLAWYIARPTMAALFAPSRGKFNVTTKGGITENGFFDWDMARPYAILLGLNALAMLFGVYRIFDAVGDQSLIATTTINMIWTVHNIIIIGASAAVASEKRQRRVEPRILSHVRGALRRADGHRYSCEVSDFSPAGVGLSGLPDVGFKAGEWVELSIFRGEDEGVFSGTVVNTGGRMLGLKLDEMTIAQQFDFSRMTFGRADIWLDQFANCQRDSLWSSLVGVLHAGGVGVSVVAKESLKFLLLRSPGRDDRVGVSGTS